MRVLIVTPAPCGSTKGNRITAERWAGRLRALGHQVVIADVQVSGPFDVLIALHATRSHDVIVTFQAESPGTPVVLCLTGTDLHLDLKGLRGDESKRLAEDSVERSTCLVLLEPEGIRHLPAASQAKARVIYQSAIPVSQTVKRSDSAFQVCVLGHLRDEKDPFLGVRAAEQLPTESRIKIVHIGSALDNAMEAAAINLSKTSLRYQWVGERTYEEAQRILAASHLMLLSSKVEGAPSAISEAVVNEVPILATRIPATVGLLGSKYPGLFPVGDAGEPCYALAVRDAGLRFTGAMGLVQRVLGR